MKKVLKGLGIVLSLALVVLFVSCDTPNTPTVSGKANGEPSNVKAVAYPGGILITFDAAPDAQYYGLLRKAGDGEEIVAYTYTGTPYGSEGKYYIRDTDRDALEDGKKYTYSVYAQDIWGGVSNAIAADAVTADIPAKGTFIDAKKPATLPTVTVTPFKSPGATDNDYVRVEVTGLVPGFYYQGYSLQKKAITADATAWGYLDSLSPGVSIQDIGVIVAGTFTQVAPIPDGVSSLLATEHARLVFTISPWDQDLYLDSADDPNYTNYNATKLQPNQFASVPFVK
jgi:hypothetical protein